VIRSHLHADDLGPSGECLTTGGTELGGGVLVWAAGENVGDLIVGGKKPLHLTRRLEPLHDPLSSSRRLVGISARLEAARSWGLGRLSPSQIRYFLRKCFIAA
jgi:hypothetical protein